MLETLLSQVYIKLAGDDAPLDFMHDLVEVRVDSTLHLPDEATIIVHDTRLHWIDHAQIAPGKTIEIASSIGGGERPLFDGEIVEIEPSFSAASQQLVIRAFDRLHRLSRGRKVRSFQNVTDGDVIQKIAKEVGLSAKVGPTTQVHDFLFQHNISNLEFLQSRAQSLGYLLFVRGKTLHCEPPTSEGAAVDLEWGVTLRDFRPRLTTVNQVERVIARGWDPKNRQELFGQARQGSAAPSVGEQRSGGEIAQAAFGVDAEVLVNGGPIRSQAEAERVAQAAADRLAGEFIVAEGACSGTPALVAGTALHISAVGDRFSGRYLVTSATHQYDASNGYSTQFSVSGFTPNTLLGALGRSAEPEFRGPVVGIVTDNDDPERLGRVRVRIPALTADHASFWARLVAPGAGNKRGILFVPEVNDEVLVVFEHDDINHPYVLGGLWNGRDMPPEGNGPAVSGGSVKRRIIKSRAGNVIILDDTDGEESITIEDAKGNKIKFDASQNSLTIDIAGDTTVKTMGNLKLKAGANLELEGSEVSVKGSEVKVNGSGMVEVKGGIIKLN